MGMLGTVLTFSGSIGMLVFAIVILISAFKTSLGWGLASLLIPFVIFVYVAKNWATQKTPFLRWAACLGVTLVGSAISFYGAYSGMG
jgi:hypothetical protein